MKKTIVHFACAATFLLGSAALAGAQRPPQPAPQPAPPAQQPTPQEQREQAAREQAEREQAEKRKQRAREQAEAQQQQDAERAKRAREQQQAEQGNPANPRQRAANADQAQVRQDLFTLERNHREIIARLDRLADVYRASGQERKLAEVEELRAKHHQRYERFLGVYRDKLGPDEFAAIDSNLRMGRERRMANARPRVEAKSAGSDTPQKP